MLQVLKHNYFVVGQNLLTSRQPSIVGQRMPSASTNAEKVTAAQQAGQRQQQQGVADDWPSQTPAASKPLTKQLSKGLFPWLPQNDGTQPALPHVTRKSSPVKVCDFSSYYDNCSNNWKVPLSVTENLFSWTFARADRHAKQNFSGCH